MGSNTEQLSKQVRRSAMDLLARREHTFKELMIKLTMRFPEEQVRNEVVRLREEGLQSDERFVESYIYSKRNKGNGPVRIKSALRQKGVSSSLVSDYLDENDECWLHCAREVFRRKFDGKVARDRKGWVRQSRFLAQRGFSMNQIKKTLNYQ